MSYLASTFQLEREKYTGNPLNASGSGLIMERFGAGRRPGAGAIPPKEAPERSREQLVQKKRDTTRHVG